MKWELHHRLRSRMDLLGVRPVDLARACEVKAPSVSNWLSGKTKVLKGDKLVKAAEFLKVHPEWLAEGKGSIANLPDPGYGTVAETSNISHYNKPEIDAVTKIMSTVDKDGRQKILAFAEFIEQNHRSLKKVISQNTAVSI